MRNTVLPRFIENFKLFLDGTKKVKFSSVGIEIAVAGPENAKYKAICHFPWSFKLRVSVTSATNSK